MFTAKMSLLNFINRVNSTPPWANNNNNNSTTHIFFYSLKPIQKSVTYLRPASQIPFLK